MEFLDEYESRPRFLFQSKQLPQPSGTDSDPQSRSSPSSALFLIDKRTLFVSVSISLVIFALAFLYFNFEPLKSLLLWLALSLLVGPFAPPSLTAGDIRVGIGPPIKEEKANNAIEYNEKSARKSTKPRKKLPEDDEGFSEKSTNIDGWIVDPPQHESNGSNDLLNGKKSEGKYEEQNEWSEADDELLRKLMGKHPVGKPGRWEAIAEGFKGKFKVDTIISKSKDLGDRKISDQDSYKKFLKDRKPMDKRVLDEAENATNAEISSINPSEEAGKKENGWTSAEDLALLNALKAFPKDVAMRWEKIATSVPGKTKSSCMKRVTELKKDFRSSKASSGQPA